MRCMLGAFARLDPVSLISVISLTQPWLQGKQALACLPPILSLRRHTHILVLFFNYTYSYFLPSKSNSTHHWCIKLYRQKITDHTSRCLSAWTCMNSPLGTPTQVSSFLRLIDTVTGFKRKTRTSQENNLAWVFCQGQTRLTRKANLVTARATGFCLCYICPPSSTSLWHDLLWNHTSSTMHTSYYSSLLPCTHIAVRITIHTHTAKTTPYPFIPVRGKKQEV